MPHCHVCDQFKPTLYSVGAYIDVLPPTFPNKKSKQACAVCIKKLNQLHTAKQQKEARLATLADKRKEVPTPEFIHKTRQQEKLQTTVPEAESAVLFITEGASLTQSQFYHKYALVDIYFLMKFATVLRDGCQNCNAISQANKLHIVEYYLEGHALCIVLQCIACGVELKHVMSHVYKDNSCEVNRDMAAAWFLSGGDTAHYTQFTTTLRCGTYTETSFVETQNLLFPFIYEQEDTMYQQNIGLVNEQYELESTKAIIGWDVQHSRSQRKFGPAPYATATFVSHTPGSTYGKIILQTHMSTHTMTEMGLTKTESKDKLTTKVGLTKIKDLLTAIGSGICDTSSTGNKLWTTIITNSQKHNSAQINNCFWHITKNVGKDWKKKIGDHKYKLKEKQGNKQYEYTYLDLKELGVTADKVKNHLIHCQKLCKENSTVLQEEFIAIVEHYADIMPGALSQKTVNDFEAWCTKTVKNAEKFCQGLKTDLEEAFHHAGIKYWRKGVPYAYNTYIAKRALQALDWNENFGKQQCTYVFRSEILEKFHKYLDSRRVGKGANNYYSPKYLIVNY